VGYYSSLMRTPVPCLVGYTDLILSLATPHSVLAFTVILGIYNLNRGIENALCSMALGYQLNWSQGTVIGALGVYDSAYAGFSGTYSVGLWDNFGNMLVNTSVLGAANYLEPGFRGPTFPT
jgi:hypothetical protein